MDDLTQPLVPVIPKSRSKADRGFNHPVLAEMLCPATKLDRLENDPEYISLFFGCHLIIFAFSYIKQLRLGNVSDEDWPAFCYEDHQCDPEDLEKGLFRGLYLLRVCLISSFELMVTF